MAPTSCLLSSLRVALDDSRHEPAAKSSHAFPLPGEGGQPGRLRTQRGGGLGVTAAARGAVTPILLCAGHLPGRTPGQVDSGSEASEGQEGGAGVSPPQGGGRQGRRREAGRACPHQRLLPSPGTKNGTLSPSLESPAPCKDPLVPPGTSVVTSDAAPFLSYTPEPTLH